MNECNDATIGFTIIKIINFRGGLYWLTGSLVIF